MHKIRIILIFLAIIFLYSCGKEVEKIKLIKEPSQNEEMISAYKKGMSFLDSGDYFAASKKFLEVEVLLPQSQWAPKSVLMASYSYYLQNYYSLAIENLKRYFKFYPKDKNMAYAHYLLAVIHFEQIGGEQHDLKPLLATKEKRRGFVFFPIVRRDILKQFLLWFQ